MKKALFLTAVMVVFSLLILCCHKDPVVDLPEEVNLGESITYLNGKVFDSKPDLYYRQFDQLFFAAFGQIKDNPEVGQLYNTLAFSLLPLRQGDYALITERNLGVAAYPGFEQIFAEDLSGYTYEVQDKEEGYFNITYLDTVAQVIKGRFKVKFCRTSKNGVKEDLEMPKHLVFEGVFHEKYTIR